MRQTKIPETTINKIVALYLNDASITEISQKLNICVAQVWRMLKKKNVSTSKTMFDYREKTRLYTIDETYFNSIDTPDKAYILGLLYADGNANKKFSQITLKLQEKDKEILDKISLRLKTNKPLHFYKKTQASHQNQYVLKITNKIIYQNLISFGIVPNKTFITKFPNISQELYSHFVRGYFDGDGCLHVDLKRKCGAVSIIGSSMFCKELQTIFQDLLEIKSVISHDYRCKEGIDVLRIRKYSDIQKFGKWIYNNSNDMFLSRKFNKLLELKRIKEQ